MSASLNSSALRVSIVSYSETMDSLIVTVSSLIASLRRAATDGLINKPCEIVLVDNRETQCLDLNYLLQTLKHEDNDLYSFELIQGHGNVGYGGGHNLALDDGNKGYHLFLNPDVELENDCLSFGIKYLEVNPHVGMVAPHATDKKNNKQHLCKSFPTVFDLFIRGFLPSSIKQFFKNRLALYENHELDEHQPTQGISIASGCFMLCRNKVMIAIGGFDPSFFLYFEDFDLSLRLNEISTIAYNPKMRIVHAGGGASQKGFHHKIYFVESAWTFFSKHGWRWFK